MGHSVLIVALLAANGAGASIPRPLTEKQETVFRRWWNDDFVWKFADLPTEGKVPKFRVPYSGYIYPDTAGGTARVLRKYDSAYLPGYRSPAAQWERQDSSAFKERAQGLVGLLGARRTPDWYGHCNGWAAAAIRHAEPQRSVLANGVIFSPADIKGLLAEIYIYNDSEMLAGYDYKMNAGVFHAILANWIGRGEHPIGVEKDPGKEKWNYPIYAYASSFGKHSPREIEVKTNVLYAKDTEDDEYNESPRLNRVLYFHYMLHLNNAGEIVGGYFFRDSSIIEMLWVPLRPKQPRRPGNEAGNPYLDVEKVLAIWRASVPQEERQKWVTIDPHEKDRRVVLAKARKLLPQQVEAEIVAVEESAPDEAEETSDSQQAEVHVAAEGEADEGHDEAPADEASSVDRGEDAAAVTRPPVVVESWDDIDAEAVPRPHRPTRPALRGARPSLEARYAD